MTHGHRQHDHAHGHAEFDDAELAELLDLSAEVLHDSQQQILDWVVAAVAGRPVRRILDLGAGTGTGTEALARRFPAAEVTALDVSAEMLARLAAKLADRPQVRTMLVEPDAGWPELGPLELAWASMSLHHMPDPDRTLAAVYAALRPGGIFAVVEMDGPPQLLPAEVGDGLGPRLWAILAGEQADRLPTMGSDWGPELGRAGFKLVDQRSFDLDLRAPLPPATGRYAELFLRRLRVSLADRLEPADRAKLDELLDETRPDSVRHRSDLWIRGRRRAWIAQRPQA